MVSSMWITCMAFVLYSTVSYAYRYGLPLDPVAKPFFATSSSSSEDPPYLYSVGNFSVPVDNFAYTNNHTYKMRYLYNMTFYKKGGPIFFYAGNEGSIEGFAKNTGIMYDLAPKFNAAIVFAEHRYYGMSKPFGENSYKNVKYLGFLASTQALADYARFLPEFKKEFLNGDDAPVIAFGGSYGGMLAAWFRMKYPHIVAGAWAASAPVLYFKGANVDPGAFDKVVTEDFVKAKCNRDAISKGWTAIKNLATTDSGRKTLNDIFHVANHSKLSKPEHADELIYFVREAFEYLAMVDYPYPTSFLKPLPGWPVKEACKLASTKFPTPPTEDAKLVEYLYEVSNLYYNYTGKEKTNCVISKLCGDPATSGLGDDALGWPWQSCTEMVMEICARGGTNDFFFDECKQAGGALNMVKNFCTKTFNNTGYTTALLYELDAPIEYGLEFAAASNIVFTNGKLDPWAVGGVFENTPGIKHASKNGVYTFYIDGAGHHLDLRQPNTCDPPPVKNARFQIVGIMECWIHPENCKTLPTPQPLPPLGSTTEQNCQPVINGYPWGQK